MASSIVEEVPSSAENIIEKVTSHQKIDRDTGLAELSRLLRSGQYEETVTKNIIDQVTRGVVAILEEVGKKEEDQIAHMVLVDEHYTEKKLGSLFAALTLVSAGIVTGNKAVNEFVKNVKSFVLNLLWDKDVRVRLAAGELYGMICKILGSTEYVEAKGAIMELLKVEYERNKEIQEMIKTPETPIDPTGEIASSEPHSTPTRSLQLGPSPATTPLNPNLAFSDVLNQASLALKDGLAQGIPPEIASNLGCAQLESSLKCVQFIAKGLGSQFGELIDQNLLDLIYPALSHQNRFIRETGFFLCATIIELGMDLKIYGRKMSEEITLGLSDFCSQSRIASAIACRRFMLKLNENEREEYYHTMLPRLCLCRYYMADAKFLLYSQESWRIIFGTVGPQLVAKYIDDVIKYYMEATTSENHAVREASCSCLGELSRKIDRTALTPFVPGLLETLRKCFNDERWHVRDAACLAAGNFFVNYPSECKDQIDSMFPLFFENLEFPIAIVRQGAAAALANIVRAYGKDVIPQTIKKIVQGLEGTENQPSETCKNLDTPGISPEIKYSYPPGQGQHFTPYARSSYPWELCDGCLYLIGDIAQLPECQSELPSLVPKILKATQFRNFSQHVVLLETTCKIIPLLVQGIGKRPFKEHLSSFFETIFYSIECENSLTSAAGKACLQQLAHIYGPNIIRSRIELYDPRFVNCIEAS